MHQRARQDPPHPGEFVRTEILEPGDLSVIEAAQSLGVSRPALSAFLNGRSDLSGTMALRFEKVFGVGMETLMRMQTAYDIARARRRADEISVGPQSVRERVTPYAEPTSNIDRDVMRRLRAEAARRRTSVSKLVEEGLARLLAESTATDALPPLPSWRSGGHLVDISDRDALYGVMDEE